MRTARKRIPNRKVTIRLGRTAAPLGLEMLFS